MYTTCFSGIPSSALLSFSFKGNVFSSEEIGTSQLNFILFLGCFHFFKKPQIIKFGNWFSSKIELSFFFILSSFRSWPILRTNAANQIKPFRPEVMLSLKNFVLKFKQKKIFYRHYGKCVILGLINT